MEDEDIKNWIKLLNGLKDDLTHLTTLTDRHIKDELTHNPKLLLSAMELVNIKVAANKSGLNLVNIQDCTCPLTCQYVGNGGKCFYKRDITTEELQAKEESQNGRG